MHVYNGLKYFSTIVAVIIRTAFELKKGMTWMLLALVSSSVAALINTYWDIVIDWGLLRRQSKNKYLRDKLVVSHKSVYFAAMVLFRDWLWETWKLFVLLIQFVCGLSLQVLNIVLRFAWMQLVLEFRLCSLHKMTIITIFSCLEIIRRGIWSFFRYCAFFLNQDACLLGMLLFYSSTKILPILAASGAKHK